MEILCEKNKINAYSLFKYYIKNAELGRLKYFECLKMECSSVEFFFLPSIYKAPGSLPSNTQCLVIHACNLSTWEEEAGGSGAQGLPQIPSGFKTSLEYIRPWPGGSMGVHSFNPGI